MERWLRDLTLDGCVWRSTTFSDLNRRTIRVSNAFNLMERSNTGEGFSQDNDSWITDCAFISNFDNPHHIGEGTGTGAGVKNIYNYNTFDNFGVFTSDYGDNVIPRGVVDVKYNISINLGGVLTTILSAAPVATIEHNTCYGSRGINVGEGADASTTIGNFRSNLFVSQNAGIVQDANFVTKGAGFVMDYNGYYDMTTAGNVDYAGNNTYLGVATSTWKTGATYHDANFGANDVYGNATFVDSSRTSATWDTSHGGAGTIANIISETIKLNGYAADGSAATFNTGYTIANYLAYIRGGFAPTNALYHNTAHDGTDIGAVSYIADSGRTLDADITQAGDTISAAGTVSVVIDANITQAGDTATGTVTVAIALNASTTQANDTIISSAVVAVALNGDINQTGDTLSATISTTGAATLDANIMQAGDMLSSTMNVSVAVMPAASHNTMRISSHSTRVHIANR